MIGIAFAYLLVRPIESKGGPKKAPFESRISCNMETCRMRRRSEQDVGISGKNAISYPYTKGTENVHNVENRKRD
jgi:hypothetical protein